jgi:hypothetical protein
MGEKNFKLIYDIRPSYEAVNVANVKVVIAKEEVEAAQKKLKQDIIRLSGYNEEELDFSDTYSCLARDVPYHVYLKKGNPGSGKNVCIFCGGDDFCE